MYNKLLLATTAPGGIESYPSTLPLNHNLIKLRLYLKSSRRHVGKAFVKPFAT
jgi:hypothetical protein